MARFRVLLLLAGILMIAAPPALAAEGHFDGAGLGIAWVIPFAGILLSIALLPLAAPSFWHAHYGKVSLAWALAFILPALASHGTAAISAALLHTLLLEYIPFLILIFTLFCVTGHIHIRGNLHGSPVVNTVFLAIGAGLASVMGTTGAAMLLIRPLITANDDRRHNAHVMVFFIFLVANIGGSLTPLGDPPLFLGYLKGVEFFWVTTHMLWPMLLAAALVLAIFFVIDSYLYRREGRMTPDPTPDSRIKITGWINVVLLAGIVATVLYSGSVRWGSVVLMGAEIEWQNVARDVVLLVIAALSYFLSPKSTRHANNFELGPVIEVAKLFAAIFVTIIPAIAILRAGTDGALAPVVNLVTGPDGQPINAMYFWLSGMLSSFLDNAPTYLVFFNLAGGDAAQLMTEGAKTLLAISAGSVFMGANTYIGNAPNFMVKAMAEARGVRMPSFFGYMAWSGCILIPVFVVLTFVFFR